MPIQLEVYRESPIEAVEKVLLHGNKITSLSVHHHPAQTPLLGQLFTFSRSSAERLYMGPEEVAGWGTRTQTAHAIWKDLPSLRELFVHKYSIPINRLAAPNLVHLALERAGYGRDVTVQYILDMLRGCPLLETLLITDSRVRAPTHDHPPVSLPRLRGIELGEDELRSGLATRLHFPQNVAVGLRVLFSSDLYGDTPLASKASIQHVLRRIDIRCITLAVEIQEPQGNVGLLVRFEGLYGSLEITANIPHNRETIWSVFFSTRGVLFSHSPWIENVRELHIVGCHFEGVQQSHCIYVPMPNVASISFNCEGLREFVFPLQPYPSSPPFSRLERIMVLGQESGLIEMAKARIDCGIPLKTLVVGRGSGRFECDHLDDYTELGELVEDLRTGCPTEILQWGIGNEVLKIWSTAETPGPVSPNGKLMVLG